MMRTGQKTTEDTNQTFPYSTENVPGMNGTTTSTWMKFEPSVWAYCRIVLLSSTGIAANVATILALMKLRSGVTHQLMFVGNLAVADLCICLCYAVLLVINEFADTRTALSFLLHVGLVFCSVTLMTIIGMSLDVYISIVIPFKYRDIVTRPRVTAYIILTWLLPLLMVVPSLIFLFAHKKDNVEFEMLVNNAFVLICFVLLILAYAAVWYRKFRMRSKHNSVRRNNNNTKALVTTALVLASFVICWTPWLLYGFIQYPGWLIRLKIVLLTIHAIVDPLIYGLRMKEISDTYKQWAAAVRRCVCCSSTTRV